MAGTNQRNQRAATAPMIDVTFQLLLFFLLTTTFRQAEGSIPGTLPAPPLDERIDMPMTVLIRSAGAGAVYEVTGLAQAVTDPQELYEQLLRRQEALGTKKVPVVIRPHADVRWEHVVEAFNQAVRAESKEVSIVSNG